MANLFHIDVSSFRFRWYFFFMLCSCAIFFSCDARADFKRTE